MFERLKELELKRSCIDEEIRNEKSLLAEKKLKLLGLKIGDVIVHGKNKGFLTSVSHGYRERFNFTANAIKKDGTKSKNSAGMWCSIDEVKKVTQ